MSSLSEAVDSTYIPAPSLVPGKAITDCRACVTIPVCNEENSLGACLDAFSWQRDLSGAPLSSRSFEVLLLLNNCTDSSAAVARTWKAHHPAINLCCVEIHLPSGKANAGTARKLLLDTAWQRLGATSAVPAALLSTDADSTVAPDWIAQNLRALAKGADAVGGRIELAEGEVDKMPDGLKSCYERDLHYGELVAQLEDLLDPQPGDPWPRHQHHFGSSLACTTQAYAQAGGMPEAPELEDMAFVHQLRRAGLRLRHEPAVRVFTSGRLNGRAKVGLAGQLRNWSALPTESAHRVQSAEFLAHRFETLRHLREAFSSGCVSSVPFPTVEWEGWAEQALLNEHSVADWLAAIHSDGLIDATYEGEREQPVVEAICTLKATIERFHNRTPLKT